MKPARVFNALHGQIGEDGNIQGLLNILNIPYTHSGLLASANAMDKIRAKHMLAEVGIAVPADLRLIEDTHVHPADFTGAHVIKPRNDGSSFWGWSLLMKVTTRRRRVASGTPMWN